MTSLPTTALAIVVVLAAVPAAQSKPDFSGTWTIDLERSESPHQGPSFEPVTFVITQSAAEVVIETRRRTATSERRYPIGSAEPTAQPTGAGAMRAYWNGATLVTEGTRVVQGQTVSVRESRALDATGTQMTLDTLLVVQHGYTFKGAQNYGATKDVYRKVTAPRDTDTRRPRPVGRRAALRAASRRRPGPCGPPASPGP